MKYRLSFARPQEQIVTVSLDTRATGKITRFGLPFWRPGRYAAQSFARNIGTLYAFDTAGNPLPVQRVSTLLWEVAAEPEQTLRLEYDYYTHQLDAGGSYYDTDHIYINGITLLLYQEGRLDQACTMELDIPEHYQLGGALHGEHRKYRFADYHQLVDSPFFASANLLSHHFRVRELDVYLWFQGECRPDWERMERDIRAYTEAQLQFFGHCPVQEYHYLYYLTPWRARHGVEHYNSTVILMGPGYRLMEPAMYKSFLEISSHEFFHTWNVKALRPADMYPYRYDAENYSRLHYITEGVTTYYGDLMLWKSGVWGAQQWLDSINESLRRHYRMGGKDAISLTQASFESWINGYDDQGMPNRRISFYIKGYLVAMLLDFELRKRTHDQISLDQVMQAMYHQIAQKERGYTREDYQGIIESLSDSSFTDFFQDYVAGTRSLDPLLAEMAEYYGLQIKNMPIGSLEESAWGLRVRPQAKSVVVDQILPGSPLIKAGLQLGDEIIGINGTQIDGDWPELLAYHWSETGVRLHLFHQKQIKEILLPCPTHFAWQLPQLWLVANQEEPQRSRFQAWRKLPTQQTA